MTASARPRTGMMRVSPLPFVARYTGSPANDVNSSSLTSKSANRGERLARVLFLEVGHARAATSPQRSAQIGSASRATPAPAPGLCALRRRRSGNRQVGQPIHDRERPHRQQAAERPRRRDDAEEQPDDRVPALPAPIRNARRRAGMAVALPRRVHPDRDDDAEQRRDRPDER